MSTPRVWKNGDRCVLVVRGDRDTTGERRLDAVVHIVSADGKPLAVCFDGIVEGFVGWLPIIWSTIGDWARTFAGTTVEVEERGTLDEE